MKMRTSILALLIISLTACKKNTSTTRHVDYPFVAQMNSGITGTVSFIEKADLGQTTVDIELQNTLNNRYVAHIHEGPPSSFHGAIYYFEPIYSHDDKISYKQNIPLLYDSALKLNCTFAFHDSLGDVVLGICGVGINK